MGGFDMGEPDLTRALVQLVDTLGDDFHVPTYARHLADRFATMLAVDAVDILLTDDTECPVSVATAGAHACKLVDETIHPGPGREALTTGDAVHTDDLGSATDRWPSYAPLAARAGYVVAHALPLRRRTDVIGAVCLLRVSPCQLGDAELALGRAVAEVATIGLLTRHRRDEARAVAAALQSALDDSVVIEQAKGILAERDHIVLDEASARLRALARSTGRRVADVAQTVVTDWATTSRRRTRAGRVER